ncbi:MAG: alpha-hydroxy-acid oxidizing enzyme [Akkermansiaceae bacterium]|nr:alpha-hydroxy-acid oxidizing enzyme [Akkermansiaceae bacterium]
MSPLRPALQEIPADVVALCDYERLAPEFIAPQAWAYLAGGSADEHALRENLAAFTRWQIEPRLLAELRGAHTRLTLAGTELAHPILVAPTAGHLMIHPDGEKAVALGAAAMQTPLVLSCHAGTAIEDLPRHPGAPLWFQLYLRADARSFLETLVRRVEAAGATALVVTVDAPVKGIRNREQRAGFKAPASVVAVHMAGAPPFPETQSAFDPRFIATFPTWDDIRWLRSITRLPVWLKGVLSPLDAVLAREAGCDGIIVSNHGGRTLDAAPSALEALPRIMDSIDGLLPVIVDGGIRRGTDVFTALALGADAVMIGRPVLHGLAVAGAPGVAHVLKILRSELEVAMVLAGCPTLADIGTTLLKQR